MGRVRPTHHSENLSGAWNHQSEWCVGRTLQIRQFLLSSSLDSSVSGEL
jgi:hypothetical protein